MAIGSFRLPVGGSSVSYDSDATVFFTATGITDTTQKSAVNALVLDLKSYGIWTKTKAIYPMVGGTATTHQYNLKDPRDLDAAFRLKFFGGWTHSSTGALPNGSSYADTFLNALTTLTNNNYHLSHYSRTQKTTGIEVDMGTIVDPRMIALDQYYGGASVKAFVCGDYISSQVLFNDTNTLGMVVGSRTSQTSAKLFMNAVQRGSTLTLSNPNALPNNTFYLGSNHSAVAYEYSTKQCAFASIGDGLTDTEVSNFYTAVQAFNTTLSRQV
jgi:hypothetical protein